MARKLLLVKHSLEKKNVEVSRECRGETISPFYFSPRVKAKEGKKKIPNLGALETRMTMVSYAIMLTVRKVDTYDRKYERFNF